MATSFFPFDAGAGSAISESQWQKMARRWLKSGVLTGYLNALAVTADGSGMTVSVNTGGAWVEGFYFENDAAAAKTIAAAHATLSRIDRVVVRLDRVANTCTLEVVTGVAASSPVAPTLSATDSLYEIGLATVLVDPTVGVIAAGKVTDTRTLVKNLTEAEASAAYAPIGAIGSRVTHSVNFAVAHNTATALGFDTERYDTHAFHDTAVNNSRMTIPAGQGGTYLIGASIEWTANATGTRGLDIVVNGVTYIAIDERPASATGSDSRQTIATVWRLNPGDYVQVFVFQTSTVSLPVTKASAFSPEFHLTRLGA